MARRRQRLFRKGVGYIVDKSVTKIEASKDIWASATVDGFRVDWANWAGLLMKELKPVIEALPAKGADPRTNVINRVVPVAQKIKSLAYSYRLAKVREAKIPETVAAAAR